MSDHRHVHRRHRFGRRATDRDLTEIDELVCHVEILTRWLAIAWIALAIAVAASLWITHRERDSRVAENAGAIAALKASDRVQRISDERGAAEAVRADCVRARNFRRIALKHGYFTSPSGRRDLRRFVRTASRRGCTL